MKYDSVKSVRRVLEVFELFNDKRQALNATEISAELEYPKSSCNALLKSMLNLGYLSLENSTMRYFPSLRVAHLGDWLPAAIFGEERRNLLEELHAETGETVTLSVRNGFSMQFVSVLPGTFPITLAVEEGFKSPLLGTAVGAALLSTYSDERLDDLFRRAERASVARAKEMSFAKIAADIQKARRDGYALAYDRILSDTGAIAMPIPMFHKSNILVIGVGGLSPRIRRAEKEIIEKMRSLISQPELGIPGQD